MTPAILAIISGIGLALSLVCLVLLFVKAANNIGGFKFDDNLSGFEQTFKKSTNYAGYMAITWLCGAMSSVGLMGSLVWFLVKTYA
jgi:hypothetical protein